VISEDGSIMERTEISW